MKDRELSPDEIKLQILQISTLQNRIKISMICFFAFTITTQSFVSFDTNISIRLEFGLQAIYYFFTLFVMVIYTKKLIVLIRSIFGDNNSTFDAEIRQVKRALFVFAFAYSIRVIRNTLVTIYWAPCFAVHR